MQHAKSLKMYLPKWKWEIQLPSQFHLAPQSTAFSRFARFWASEIPAVCHSLFWEGRWAWQKILIHESGPVENWRMDTKNDGPWKMYLYLLSNKAIFGIYVEFRRCTFNKVASKQLFPIIVQWMQLGRLLHTCVRILLLHLVEPEGLKNPLGSTSARVQVESEAGNDSTTESTTKKA